MSGMFLAKTRYGDREIPRRHISPVLDNRIVRIIGDDDSLVSSGFYSRPFLVWNAKQELYHRFATPYDALRQCLRAKDWEGVEPSTIPDGDKQRVISYLARHRYLQLLLNSETDRHVFGQAWAELVADMGQPQNEAKQQALDLTRRAGGPDEPQADKLLSQAMEQDHLRLQQIEVIGAKLNWRAALIAETIVRQQQLMNEVGQWLQGLAQRHSASLTPTEASWLIEEVQEARTLLRGAVDRPFRGLARRDEYDLVAFLTHQREQDQAEANHDLRRAVVAHCHFTLARQIQVILYRVALGQCRGERFERIYNEIATLHAGIDPREGAVLRNNPLRRLKGYLNDTLMILRSPQRDWKEVKQLLSQAAATFG